jgi:hypothetical protein
MLRDPSTGVDGILGSLGIVSLPEAVTDSFGGTTEIMKEIIGRGLGV